MQNHDAVQLEITHLLFELSCCVNDLQGYRRRLSVDEVKQAELSLQKLNALITSASHQPAHLQLAAG